MTEPASKPTSALPGFVHIADRPLVFGNRQSATRGRYENPLEGLMVHGPHSLLPTGDHLRVATVSVSDQQQRLFGFLRRLHLRAQVSDRRAYVPEFPGFEGIFGARLEGSVGGQCHPTITMEAPGEGPDDPHTNLANALIRTILVLQNVRENWDVIAVLPTSSASHCNGHDGLVSTSKSRARRCVA